MRKDETRASCLASASMMQDHRSRRKRVVIVGAGPAGISCLRQLVERSKKPYLLEIAIVTPSNYILRSALTTEAALRPLDQAKIAVKIELPERNTSRGTVSTALRLGGRVVGVDLNARTLAICCELGGLVEQLPFDFLVWSAGVPHALVNSKMTTCGRRFERLRGAKSVCVIGGGPVGVEMSASLARRGLDVTLVHAHEHLLYPHWGDIVSVDAAREISSTLADLGVRVLLNERAVVRTKDDRSIVYDLLNTNVLCSPEFVLECHRARASETFLPEGLKPFAHEDGSHLFVDDFLRLTGLSNVFVGGDAALDVAAHREPNRSTVGVAVQDGIAIASSIDRLVRGKSPLKFTHSRHKPPILRLQLGPKDVRVFGDTCTTYSFIFSKSAGSRSRHVEIEKQHLIWSDKPTVMPVLTLQGYAKTPWIRPRPLVSKQQSDDLLDSFSQPVRDIVFLSEHTQNIKGPFTLAPRLTRTSRVRFGNSRRAALADQVNGAELPDVPDTAPIIAYASAREPPRWMVDTTTENPIVVCMASTVLGREMVQCLTSWGLHVRAVVPSHSANGTHSLRQSIALLSPWRQQLVEVVVASFDWSPRRIAKAMFPNNQTSAGVMFAQVIDRNLVERTVKIARACAIGKAPFACLSHLISMNLAIRTDPLADTSRAVTEAWGRNAPHVPFCEVRCHNFFELEVFTRRFFATELGVFFSFNKPVSEEEGAISRVANAVDFGEACARIVATETRRRERWFAGKDLSFEPPPTPRERHVKAVAHLMGVSHLDDIGYVGDNPELAQSIRAVMRKSQAFGDNMVQVVVGVTSERRRLDAKRVSNLLASTDGDQIDPKLRVVLEKEPELLDSVSLLGRRPSAVDEFASSRFSLGANFITHTNSSESQELKVSDSWQRERSVLLSRGVGPVVRATMRSRELQQRLLRRIPFEDLEIGEVLGRGASGVVHRGLWFGTDVAVKLAGEDVSLAFDADEFRREVAFMSLVRHENLALGLGGDVTSPSKMWLVLKLETGGTLRDALDDRVRSESLTWRLNMVLDVARGLRYLHGMSLAHFDVKSTNVVLSSTSARARLIDFGSVTYVDEHVDPREAAVSSRSSFESSSSYDIGDEWTTLAGETGRRTSESDFDTLSSSSSASSLSSVDALSQSPRRQSTSGTMQWASPEMLRQEQHIDISSDVYSFGVVMWEALTRLVPWASMRAWDASQGVASGKLRLDAVKHVDRVADEVRNVETLKIVRDAAELADECMAFKAKRRPSMAHAYTRLVALVHRAVSLDSTPESDE